MCKYVEGFKAKTHRYRTVLFTICSSLFISVLFSSSWVHAQAPQASDIWIAKLNIESKQPINDLLRVTNTNSYTNQPYFFDNNRLYYTQMHGEGNTVQSDIHLFDLALGQDANLTQSAQSEYSATPVPNKHAMSVIRVNLEGKQELWELDLQGKPSQHLAPQIEPVGYHVWINTESLLLFVLGEPHTLQKVNITQAAALGVIVDSYIGPSLYRYQDSPWFLYSKNYAAIAALQNSKTSINTVFSEVDKGNWIYAFNAQSGKTKRVASLPSTSEYFALTPSGFLITSDGEQILSRQIIIQDQKLTPLEKWRTLKIKEKQCASGVSRIGVSGDGSMIALVCPRIE